MVLRLLRPVVRPDAVRKSSPYAPLGPVVKWGPAPPLDLTVDASFHQLAQPDAVIVAPGSAPVGGEAFAAGYAAFGTVSGINHPK